MKPVPALFLLLIVTLLFVFPADAGETAPPEPGSGGLDPVIASIIRMLEEKVPPETISIWLDQIDTPAATVSADNVIALTRAGASEELIRKILALGGAAKTPTSLPPEREQTQESGLPVPVALIVGYSPQLVDYQLTPWDLFVYVDGKPVLRADGWSAHSSDHRAWLTTELPLSPGRHVIRLLQEQHELKSKRKGTWSHAARVLGGPIVLDLVASGDWQVRIEAREGNRALSNASVQYQITRNGKSIGEAVTRDIREKEMPPLCDELEQTGSAKELSSKSGRAAMEHCVRWAEIWEGIESVPERAEVRAEMQTQGFDLGWVESE